MKVSEDEIVKKLVAAKLKIHHLIKATFIRVPTMASQNFLNEITVDGFSIIRSTAQEKQLDPVSTFTDAIYFWHQALASKFTEETFENWKRFTEKDRTEITTEALEGTDYNYSKSYAYVLRRYEKDTTTELELRDFLNQLFAEFFSVVSFIGRDPSLTELCESQLGHRFAVPIKEINAKIEKEHKPETEASVDEKLEELTREIDELVGLKSVKNELKNLINIQKINQLRKTKGLKAVDISLHCVFTGAPGTGKTSVARIIARAYKILGLLQKGQMIEAERSVLVAGYVGQTAMKTQEVLERSLDGVLFIDEAYSLSRKGDDYGRESIETILKFMEDHRDRFVLIVAGYEAEMNEFLESNPGLKSRFNKHVHFPNYTSAELLEILKSSFAKHGFLVDPPALKKFKRTIDKEIKLKSESFGNARFVRNLCEKTIQNQFMRVSKISNPSVEDLNSIVALDVA